jgi:RND family efflux transporter MFP subunit
MKRVVLPLLVFLAGIGVLAGMIATRPKPKKAEARVEGTLVSYVKVEPAKEKVRLPVQGTVTAAESVQLIAEISGRVVWRSPNLVPGGVFKKGEPLLRVDAREYELAVEQQKAAVDRARLEIEVERSRQAVAEREWSLLEKTRGLGGASEPVDRETALALRGPQLRTARVALESASSGLDRARLSLERTTLRAPFTGLVQTAQVDVGQVVAPGQPVAALVGTDRYWVQVSVPMDWLSWLLTADGKLADTPAVVRADIGDRSIERAGRVVRLLGDVDPVGRMARVLIEIDDPLGRKADRAGAARMPLLLGTFVHVELGAAELSNVIAIPDRALREGGQVYLVDPAGRLEVRPVGVAYRTGGTVYVRQGLTAGDRVVTSRLSAPVAGMVLRTADEPAAAPAAGAAAAPAEARP